MPRAFISYVDADSDCAAALALGLKAAGFAAWRHETGFRPGRAHLDNFFEAIDASSVMIVVISRDSVHSAQVDAEMSRAFGAGKPILPVLWGLTYADFEALKPTWDILLRDTTTLHIPPGGLHTIGARLIPCLQALGSQPRQKPNLGQRWDPSPAAGQTPKAPDRPPVTGAPSGGTGRRRMRVVATGATIIFVAALSAWRTLHEIRHGDLAYTAHNRTDNVGRSHDAAITTHPNSPSAYAAQGDIDIAQHRYADAEEAYRMAVKLDPGNAGYHKRLGDILYHRGRMPEAEAHYRRAVVLRPDDAHVVIEFAAFEHNFGDWDYHHEKYTSALPHYKAAVHLQPENAGYRSRLTLCLRTASREARLPGAPKGIRKPLKVTRRHPKAIVNRRPKLILQPSPSGYWTLCAVSRKRATQYCRSTSSVRRNGRNPGVCSIYHYHRR